MKKSIFILVFSVFSVFNVAQSTYAQNINVGYFRAVSDTDAMHNGGVLDHNGDKCALIKVLTTQTGFTFDLGSSYIVVKREDHYDIGEIWLYVPKGTKRIKIYHPTLGYYEGKNGEDYYSIETSLESGRCYKMKLITGTLTTTFNETAQKQYLVFDITPRDAVLEVNHETWELDEFGHAEKNVSFGTYSYKVSAKNYHETGGYIDVNDPDKKQELRISLKPAFGWFEIPAESGLSGAVVYLDNERVGTVPFKSQAISSGSHTLKLTMNLYKTYEQTITITDSLTSTILPEMEANFAETEFRVTGNAEIYIDGEFNGRGSWKGPLETNDYTVECKLAGHLSTSQVVHISPASPKVIELTAPSPIYGSLEITSTPSSADVYIDGNHMGQTPLFVNGNIIIGKHEISISKQNYKTITETVEVKENKTETVSARLSSIGYFTVDSKPSLAELYIDGKYVGITPYKQEMPSGEYAITLKHRGYEPFSQEMHFDSSNPNIMLSLRKRYFKPSMFYLGGGFQAGSMMAAGGFLGAYIKHINIEADYLAGMSESDEVFWLKQSSQTSEPFGYTYKPTYIGIRLGYGIDVNNRLRITPLMGAGSVQLKGTLKSGSTSGFTPENAYAISASIGAKAEYAITPWFAAFLRPEISFAVSKTDTFTEISNASSKAKGFASGFNALVGLYFYF